MTKYISALILFIASTTFPLTAFADSSQSPANNWQMNISDDGLNTTAKSKSQESQSSNKIEELQKKYEQELLKMQELRQEYENELQKMQSDDKNYDSLKEQINKIILSGFIRAKYDNDTAAPIGSGSNNRHFYMDLEGKMKVSKNWEAHFQSETRKGYTVNQSWRNGDNGSDDEDGTFQRIWVEGNTGKVGVTLGTKWWGYGFQNVPFGHAADGIQLDYNFAKDWNAKTFLLRPRQGDLISMPNGESTTITGINLTGKLTKNLETSITFASNKNYHDDQKMSRMGAVEFRTQAAKNLMLTGTYVKTNADNYNTSKEYRLDYKGTKLNDVGSFGTYIRYVDFSKYGDYSHDDEWGSLPSDTKGWFFGIKYVPYKNIEWETFYSNQTRFNDSQENHNAKRHLFRTQVDFHF